MPLARLTLVLLACGLPLAGQAAGPSVTIIRPAPRSVITSNSLIFEAEAAFPGDSVALVEFRANYFAAGYQGGSLSMFYQYASDTLLAVDSTPPYQWIWDISAIQDHYLGRMVASVVARSRHGVAVRASTNDFVVDRTPDSRPRRHLAARSGRPDDSLRLDPNAAAQQFMNGDNTVTFQAWWTPDTLYVLVEVMDRNLLPFVGAGDDGQRSWWNGDDVELFIDGHNRRSPLPDSSVYQVVLHPLDSGYGGHVSLFDTVRFDVPTRAAVGPEGYTLVAAVAWKALSVQPRPGLALGFELANVDLDKRDGLFQVGSWDGLHLGNLHNPSEWGELTLARPAWHGRLLAGLGLLLAAGLALLLARRTRRRREDVPERPAAGASAPAALPRDSASAITTAVVELVTGEFQNEKLNLQFAADRLRRNAKYVSTVFKKDMSMNFTAYLNKVRLEKADELLRTTDRSISQISIEVGYNSYKYFSTVYRKYFGKNPSMARGSKAQ